MVNLEIKHIGLRKTCWKGGRQAGRYGTSSGICVEDGNPEINLPEKRKGKNGG